MLAMILAAGYGTRLKPWTDSHPKALVEVGGRPMLDRVMEKLISSGFTHIIINVHHFADQIKDYLASQSYDAEVLISDESGLLMDTGGGIVKAYNQYGKGEPMLVHNVDILSDADLHGLMDIHEMSGDEVTLLTSGRDSSRKLYFDGDGKLRGWVNLKSGELKPAGVSVKKEWTAEAFSGIHVVSAKAVTDMYGKYGDNPFPIMDYLLSTTEGGTAGRFFSGNLHLIDIGKPATLSRANSMF